MCLLMNLQEFFKTDSSVDLGSIELLVAEDSLDGADISASVMHQGGHGVAEDVASSRLVDAGALDVSTTVFG